MYSIFKHELWLKGPLFSLSLALLVGLFLVACAPPSSQTPLGSRSLTHGGERGGQDDEASVFERHFFNLQAEERVPLFSSAPSSPRTPFLSGTQNVPLTVLRYSDELKNILSQGEYEELPPEPKFTVRRSRLRIDVDAHTMWLEVEIERPDGFTETLELKGTYDPENRNLWSAQMYPTDPEILAQRRVQAVADWLEPYFCESPVAIDFYYLIDSRPEKIQLVTNVQRRSQHCRGEGPQMEEGVQQEGAVEGEEPSMDTVVPPLMPPRPNFNGAEPQQSETQGVPAESVQSEATEPTRPYPQNLPRPKPDMGLPSADVSVVAPEEASEDMGDSDSSESVLPGLQQEVATSASSGPVLYDGVIEEVFVQQGPELLEEVRPSEVLVAETLTEEAIEMSIANPPSALTSASLQATLTTTSSPPAIRENEGNSSVVEALESAEVTGGDLSPLDMDFDVLPSGTIEVITGFVVSPPQESEFSIQGISRFIPDANRYRNLDQAQRGYNNGYLRNGKEFPIEGAGFRRRDARRDRTHRGNWIWSTDLVIDAITWIAGQIFEHFPDSPHLFVGNLTALDVGSNPPHKSHRNGLEVDLAFYTKSQNLENFWNPDRGNRGDWREFDFERNWKLLKMLAEIPSPGVAVIYVDTQVRHRLCHYARDNGKNLSRGSEDHQVLRQLEHWDGHRDHYHVRFECPNPGCETLSYIRTTSSGC